MWIACIGPKEEAKAAVDRRQALGEGRGMTPITSLYTWMYGYMRGIVAMPSRNMGILGEAPDRKEGGFLMSRIEFLTLCNCSKMKQGCV